jgi:DNA-binding MarR family transcriptional regulator
VTAGPSSPRARCETGRVASAPTPDPDPNPELLARFSLAVTRLARILRQQEAARPTPAAESALATIVRDGPISLGDLALAERVSPSTITKIVSRLEADEVIERVIDPTDRRVHRVQLSAKGRRDIDLHRSRRNAWLAEQLGGLDDASRADLRVVVEVLERLTASEGTDPVIDAHHS